MLLLLEINFLHLILPVALLLAGWPPPIPQGGGGLMLWPWPWQGGWGGDPEPGTYIYIYKFKSKFFAPDFRRFSEWVFGLCLVMSSLEDHFPILNKWARRWGWAPTRHNLFNKILHYSVSLRSVFFLDWNGLDDFTTKWTNNLGNGRKPTKLVARVIGILYACL